MSLVRFAASRCRSPLTHATALLLAAVVSFSSCSSKSTDNPDRAVRSDPLSAGRAAPDRQPLPYGLGSPHVAGELIVKFTNAPQLPLAADRDAMTLLQSLDLEPKDHPVSVTGALLVVLPAAAAGDSTTGEELEAARKLERSGIVDYVWANNLIRPEATLPNDPDFGEQWALHDPATDEDIDAPEAWELTTGCSDVRVAVIDSGVGTHPDVAPNIWLNPCEDLDSNGSPDDTNDTDEVCGQEVYDGRTYADDYRGWNFVNNSPDTTDALGHGTQVAGIIGAVGDNNLNVSGVSHTVRLVPIKVMHSGLGTVYDASLAIEYATRLRVDLINTSWGSSPGPLLEQAIAAADAVGIPVIAAAGNQRRNMSVVSFRRYPASYPHGNVISVTATSPDGSLWENTSSGDGSNYGEGVDLGAPGQDIVSTNTYSGTATRSGTSMAAPFVTGVAALLICKQPGITMAELRTRLFDGDPLESLSGTTVTGRRLNAHRALSGGSDPPPLGPPGTPVVIE